MIEKVFVPALFIIHWSSISNIKQIPKLIIINISKRERIVSYITKYFYICNHPVSIALYHILSNVHFGLKLYIILLILLNYCDMLPIKLHCYCNRQFTSPPSVVKYDLF